MHSIGLAWHEQINGCGAPCWLLSVPRRNRCFICLFLNKLILQAFFFYFWGAAFIIHNYTLNKHVFEPFFNSCRHEASNTPRENKEMPQECLSNCVFFSYEHSLFLWCGRRILYRVFAACLPFRSQTCKLFKRYLRIFLFASCLLLHLF